MTEEPKRILLYQGGRDFGLDKTYNHFKNILRGFIVDCYNTVDVFNTKAFFFYDTVIFFSQEGQFTEDQEGNLLEFVASGKGFVGLHGASASFKAHPKYFEMLGGRFVSHKGVKKIDVKILDKEHQITMDLEDFQFVDEPYRHDFSVSKDIHILGEANYHDENDPDQEPIMWVNSYDKGRIFFSSLGHRNNSLKKEIFQTIIKRAVNWVLDGTN